RNAPPVEPSETDFDDTDWETAAVVTNGPWRNTPPPPIESPAQREHPVTPYSILAAGALETQDLSTTDVYAIAEGFKQARCFPDGELTSSATRLLADEPLKISGRAGESKFVTFDFAFPVHGYPYVDLATAT